jgi:hypothetical protein
VPDDLSSIEGLADKHRRVLARQHVTDLRGLVQADRRVIHRTMANLRPRPTLELVSRWQDDARSKLDEVVTDASQWHTAASFVIIFGQRQREGAWERRVEAERTEVEPELRPQRWDGWDCAPLCAWMTSQLGQPASPTEPEHRSLAGPLSLAEFPPSAGPPSAETSTSDNARTPAGASSAPRPGTGRPQLRIDSAALIDAAGRTDVVTSGQPAADPRTEFTAPVRVVLTVSGGRPGTRLQAVTRIQRPHVPGWNPRDPVTPSAAGRAEFDLSGVPAGEHQLSLIAWAPDASAKPVSAHLPRVTIRGA